MKGFTELAVSFWSLWRPLHGGQALDWDHLLETINDFRALNVGLIMESLKFAPYLLHKSSRYLFMAFKRYHTPCRDYLEFFRQDHLGTALLPSFERWLAPLLVPSNWRFFAAAGADEEGVSPVMEGDTSSERVSLILLEAFPQEEVPNFLARTLALLALAKYQQAKEEKGTASNLWFTEKYETVLKAMDSLLTHGVFDLSLLSDFSLFWELHKKAISAYLVRPDFTPDTTGGSYSLSRLLKEFWRYFSPQEVRLCPVCGERRLERPDQKYCSNRCRVRAYKFIQALRKRFPNKPTMEEIEDFLNERLKHALPGTKPFFDLEMLIKEAYQQRKKETA